MKIAVLGTGAYSIAITSALDKNNLNVTMWTHDKNNLEGFNKHKSFKSILDYKFSSNVKVTASLEEALTNVDIIYIITASKFFKTLILDMKKYYNKNTPICIATKGIDDSSKEFLSNIAKNNLNTKTISVLSGPTFAIDIINGEPVALALGSKDKLTTDLVVSNLTSNRLKIRPNNDLIGVQICGSIKNCVAIAAGILNGMGCSNSTTAFLINEAMHDIMNTIYYLGGKKSTILSYAGIGDLVLTCTSTKSRNFSFGYIIGKYNDINKTKEYLDSNTVEGYYAIASIRSLLRKNKIKVPLINLIYDIVYDDENPDLLINFLIEKK